MMMNMPGRDYEEDEEYGSFEAKAALRTLFEAEEIKMSDDDFLVKITEELETKRTILDRISGILCDVTPPPSMKAFVKRLRDSKLENEAKEVETPEARRNRISMGKVDKTFRDQILTKFT